MPKLNAPLGFLFFGHSVPNNQPLPYTNLYIANIENDGSMDGELSDNLGNVIEIGGSYNETTGVINFNNAAVAGLILSTTFFTGTALANPDGTVAALFGTWTLQDFGVVERGKRKRLQVRHRNGPWMATNPQAPVL
jgi:hypothetical protein